MSVLLQGCPAVVEAQDQLGFMCTVQRTTIETLVSLGWLHADQQDDLAAIARAFRRFAGRAFAVVRNGARDRWYNIP